MADRNLALSLLISAKDAASAVIAKVRAAVSGAGAQNAEYAKQTQAGTTANTRFADSVVGLTQRLLGLIAAFVSLQGARSALNAILDTGGMFERLGNQMTSAFKSIADGAKATAWIAQFTKDTPFQLQGVTNAFLTLKNFGLNPMDGTLQAIADKSAELGGSQETLQGISLALGQAWAKQKLQGEEILQLIERGVPVWELLQRVTGKNVEELNKLSASGELGRDVIKALIDEIGQSSAGASASMMSSWEGLTSNLRDMWSSFLNDIAKSGTLDYFKAQIQELLNTVQGMAASGELQKTAQAISDFFVGAATSIKDAVLLVRDYSGAFKALATVLVGSKIAGMVTAIGSSAGAASVGVGRLVGALGSLANVARASLYGALAGEIFKIVSAYQQKQAIEANTANNQKELESKTQALTARYAALSAEIGITIQSMADLDKAVADGKVRFDEQAGAWVGVVDAMRDYDAEVAKAVENQDRIAGAFGKTVGEMTDIGQAADEALTKFREWGGESGRNIEAVATGLRRLSDFELSGFKNALQQSFDVGINRTDELVQALNAIKTEQVSRAWQTLGKESSAALKGAAEKAKEAYLVVKNSGTASAADLNKAWDAYLQKLSQVRSSLNKLSDEDESRKNQLAQIDKAGQDAGTPQQASNDRYLALTRKNSEMQSALRKEDYAEAVRIAREKEKLAADNAMADAQAAKDGEIASYKAYDSKQLYIKAIQDTKNALNQLGEAEKAAVEQADGAQAENPIDAQQQKLTNLQTTMQQLQEPVALTLNSNVDETLEKMQAILSTAKQINDLNLQPGAANLDSSLDTEVMKRGARR